MKDIYSADTPSFYVAFEDPRGRDTIQKSFSILKEKSFQSLNLFCEDNRLYGNLQSREIPSETELIQKTFCFLKKMEELIVEH